MLCPQLPSVSFPTGLVDSGVTQTPKYLIKPRKQQVILRCSPESGHLSVYWYQQALGQGPQFLVQYYNGQENEKGNMPDRFSVEQFGDSSSQMNLSSLELTDSAVYLCASSKTQPCMIRCLWDKNTSALAQEVAVRVTASLPGLDRSDRLSQKFFLCSVLMLPKIMLGKYYFTCLYI